MVSSVDLGNDYEECLILNKKFSEVEQEIQVENEKIEELATLANNLASVGHSTVETVHERKQVLSERWKKLKELASKRKEHLASVLQVFLFFKSCDELLDNINEKV